MRVIKINPALEAALLSVKGETMLPDTDEARSTCIIIKSNFEYDRNPNCLIAVTPMGGMYDGGPVFRLYIQLISQYTKEPIYSGDIFLDITKPDELRMIQQLTRQKVFHLHFFNMDLVYAGSKRINWNPQTASDIKNNVLPQLQAHLSLIPEEKRDWAAARKAMEDDFDI